MPAPEAQLGPWSEFCVPVPVQGRRDSSSRRRSVRASEAPGTDHAQDQGTRVLGYPLYSARVYSAALFSSIGSIWASIAITPF